jgi:hypothetical protein
MGARFRRLSEVGRSRYMSRCLLPPLPRRFPRPFAREFSGGLQEPSSLRRVCCSPLRIDVSRGSRAGLTGWYSGGENERQ